MKKHVDMQGSSEFFKLGILFIQTSPPYLSPKSVVTVASSPRWTVKAPRLLRVLSGPSTHTSPCTPGSRTTRDGSAYDHSHVLPGRLHLRTSSMSCMRASSRREVLISSITNLLGADLQVQGLEERRPRLQILVLARFPVRVALPSEHATQGRGSRITQEKQNKVKRASAHSLWDDAVAEESPHGPWLLSLIEHLHHLSQRGPLLKNEEAPQGIPVHPNHGSNLSALLQRGGRDTHSAATIKELEPM